VHISPDGTRLAAGAKDGSVLVWDLSSGDVVAKLPPQDVPVSCLRWSKSGDRLAIALGDFVDRDTSLLLIWMPQESALVTEQPLAEPAGALDWFGDDRALLVAAWSGQAIVWNVNAGAPGETWQVDKDQVSSAAWSPDCPLVTKLLANQSRTGSVP
jgi:WD40 repeat protein